MSKAKDRILARLMSRKQDVTTNQMPIFSPGIQLSTEERIHTFTDKLTSVRAEVHLVDKDNWTETLKRLCREKQLNTLLYAPQGPLADAIENAWVEADLPSLHSHTQSIDEWKDELFFETDAAITSARAGIAETGTLVLWPTESEPRSYSLVPPVHIAVLEADKLYNTFEEIIEQEQWANGLPTNALLISGPSKSADIEQTLAYGVHGPTELIVLLKQ